MNDDAFDVDRSQTAGGRAGAGERASAEELADAGERANTSEPTNEPPNVVLLVMDTARARDVLDRRDVMPNLHSIASSGTTFSNVFTTAPWTLPSHASMFTGKYTSDHGTHAGSTSFDPDGPPIAERLREGGYQTVAFSNNSWVSRDFGFDCGFDEFNTAWELFDGGDLISVAKEHQGATKQLLELARQVSWRRLPSTVVNLLYATLLRRRYDDGAWLTNWRIRRWYDQRRASDQPFFLFVNYLEPHLEYRPPRGYRSQFLPEGTSYAEASDVNQDAWSYLAGTESMDEQDFETLRGLYRGELRYLDERIGALVEFLRDRGELSNTVLFVAGDHGENIGDHGLMDHQYCLYDTLTHVPVVCHAPDRFGLPSRRDGLRELRDLFPTILDVAGLERQREPAASQRSLLDPRGREYVLGEYVAPQPDVDALGERARGEVQIDLSQYDRGLRCIRTEEWKLVEDTDGEEKLYCFPAPGEEVRATDPPENVREQLRSTLDEEHGPMATPSESVAEGHHEVDEDTQQRLEDLGYVYRQS